MKQHEKPISPVVLTSSESRVWCGVLTLETMFAGSKSENIFPVLTSNDSKKFRLRLKDMPQGEDLLGQFIGKKISVYGVADNLRGHLRILSDFSSIQLVESHPQVTAEHDLSNLSTPCNIVPPDGGQK